MKPDTESLENKGLGYLDGIVENGTYYRRYGQRSACPLVMVVGYGGNLATWTEPYLEQLSTHTDLLVFDHLGSGSSRAVPPEESITFNDYARMLREMLDELQIKQCNLLGYSMGGCIALDFWRNNRELVRQLILVATTGGGRCYKRTSPEILQRAMQPQGSNFEEMFFDFLSISMPIDAIERHRDLLQRVCDITSEPPTPVRVLEMKMKEFKQFDASSLLAEIDCPTLIVHGKDDTLMPHENAETLAHEIRQSQLVLIDHCGHYPHIEHRDATVNLLREFLCEK